MELSTLVVVDMAMLLRVLGLLEHLACEVMGHQDLNNMLVLDLFIADIAVDLVLMQELFYQRNLLVL